MNIDINDKPNIKKMILFYVCAIVIIGLGVVFLYSNYYSFITTTYLSLQNSSQYKVNIKSLHTSNNDNTNYTWKIEDESIATVSEDGIITPLKNGITTLIIKSKKGFNTKKVTIEINGLEENTINNTDNNLNNNTNEENKSNNNEINNNDEENNNILTIPDIYLKVGTRQIINIENIKLENYSKDIIEIENSNTIKALKEGETSIKATANNGQTTTFKVYVTKKDIEVTEVKLNKTNITMNIGDTNQLSATITPTNATNKNITWISSNNNVAVVDQNGKITAKTNGTTTITVQSNNGKKSTCKVTVNTKKESKPTNIDVTSISLNKSSIIMNIGNTEQLSVTITPTNATNKNITWSSSNNNVAEVDKNGKITAKVVGSILITATSHNGIVAKCLVTVKQNSTTPTVPSEIKVTGINLSETSKTLYLNGNSHTVNLTANVTPTNATNKNITWSSSNNNVAKVENGIVTAINPGTAIITAKSSNNITANFTLNVKKKVIIVIGASQVVRMNNYKTSYISSNTNYSYSVQNKTLNYVCLSGSGFAYQTGVGWNSAKSIIDSYASQKNNIEFYVFFPLSGNDIKTFTCSNISINNSTMISYANNFNNVISNVKNSGYNVTAYVVSMHPVKVSQRTNSNVVTNENSNSCKKNYRSNKKYYQFNNAMQSIINSRYPSNLKFEDLFEHIMLTNTSGKNYSYKVTYNTTDGIHWDSATTDYYVNLMLNNSGLL